MREWDLERLAEPVDYHKMKKDPRIGLRIAGATDAECAFLVQESSTGRWSGRRVELNALTSPRFIEFLEHKFAALGVKKVVPAASVLKSAYRRAWANAVLQDTIETAAAAIGQGDVPAFPRGLASKLAADIDGTTKTWDEALATFVRERRAKEAARRGR